MKGAEGVTKKRVQFIFPDQTVKKLDLLKKQMGASSRTEVLKVALELLHWAFIRLDKGEEIAAVRGEEIAETIAIPGAHPPPSPKGEQVR